MWRRLTPLAAALWMLMACTPAQDTRPLPTRMQLEAAFTPSESPALTASPTLDAPAVRALDFWQPADGQLSTGQSEIWTFAAQQGDNISLRALGESLKLMLMLYSPEGVLLREGESILTQVSATGIYSVQVSAIDGTGAYQIGLGYSDRPNPNAQSGTPIPAVVGVPTPLPNTANLGAFITELANGQTVGETLNSATTAHVYTYSGVAGQYLTVSLTRVSGELDPLVTLYAPDSLPIATDSDSGGATNALIRAVRLPTDGLYTVQVSGSGKIGAYALNVESRDIFTPESGTPVFAPTATRYAPALTPTLEQVVNGGRLTAHQPALGRLNDAADLRTHLIDLDSNVLLTLMVSPTLDSPLIPRVELIDVDGVPIAAVTGSTSPQDRTALINSLLIEQAGTYTVLVMAEGETFGDYEISYGVGTTARTQLIGEVRADTTVEGELAAPHIRDAWYAHFKQGDVISAAMIPLDDRADPVLELVAQDGTLYGIDSKTGASRSPQINGVRILHDGLYYFRVSAAQPAGIGRYALVWRYLDIAPTPDSPREVLPLLTVNDRVDESAYRFYPFYGRAGQRLRVMVTADPQNEFDGVAALLDPDAQVIAEGDDYEGSLNPVFSVTLPRDGTYNLRVNGYLTGGAYRVLIEELIP